MVNYSKKVLSKKFYGQSMKEAYLKACKWVSTNVIAKDELNRSILVKYDKDSSKLPTVEVTLFVRINETEIREDHCTICKQVSGSFFLNKKLDCAWCKLNAYHKRTDETINRKLEYIKSLISDLED